MKTESKQPRLPRAILEGIEYLTAQAYAEVFNLLDWQATISGDEAGRIATLCEDVVRKELTKLWECD
jgi:hypothetical protein